MPEPKNIEDFKLMVGMILGTLYAEHPKDRWDDSEDFFDARPAGLDSEIFDHTISYLLENGYLTRSGAGHIRLNDRSFHLLQKELPHAPQETLGSSLSKWSGDVAGETGKATLTSLATFAMERVYELITGV